MEEKNTNQSEITPQVASEDQASPKNIFNKIGIRFSIVGIIFIIVLVGSGMYFLSLNRIKTSPITAPQQNIQSTPTITTQNKKVEPATEAETRNWQVYKNKDFTIKYPPDTKLDNTTSVFDWFGYKYVSLFTINQIANHAEDKNFYAIAFTVVKNIPQTTAEEIAKKDISVSSKERETQVINSFSSYVNGSINGLYYLDPGKKLTGKQTVLNHDVINGKYAVVIEVKNNIAYIFRVRGNNYGLSDEQLQIFDKVLSAFTPNQIIMADKPLDQLIQFTLPSGWRIEKQDKDVARKASGEIVIKSSDFDDKNPPIFLWPDRPGLSMAIYKNYGGSVYTRDDKYKTIYDEIHDPNPGGATNHDLTKLTIAGYPAISYFYTFEGYEHTYNIWQDDNIWTISVYSYQEPNYKNQMDSFLSSITLNKEN